MKFSKNILKESQNVLEKTCVNLAKDFKKLRTKVKIKLLLCHKTLQVAYQMKPPPAEELYIGTRMSQSCMILVFQPERRAQGNLIFRNAVTLKLTEIGRKRFIFIIYSSNSVGLQNFTEIQGGRVNCSVDLTWHDRNTKHYFRSIHHQIENGN
jgi:hypothetical protein